MHFHSGMVKPRRLQFFPLKHMNGNCTTMFKMATERE